MDYLGLDYQKKRIEENQEFLLKLLHFHIGNYYPLRKWLGIDYKGKIDEISHLSYAYNTKYFKKGKKWYKQQTRVYQQPDLGYKLTLLLDRIPQIVFSLLPSLLQPVYGLGALMLVSLTTTTYQPSMKDTMIVGPIPNNNYGSMDSFGITTYTSASSGYDYIGLLHFDISDMPANVIISSGLLDLYNYYNAVNYTTAQNVYVDRLTQTNWTELGATYNTYNGTNAWSTAWSRVSGPFTTTDEAYILLPPTYPAWREWNITNIVSYSYSNVSKQVHLAVRRTTGIANNDHNSFYSKEYTTNLTLRPKLTVTYTGPVTTTTTAALKSTLETSKRSTTATQSLLEATKLSPTALYTILEKIQSNPTAVIAYLQHEGIDTTALQALLERQSQNAVSTIANLNKYDWFLWSSQYNTDIDWVKIADHLSHWTPETKHNANWQPISKSNTSNWTPITKS